MTDIQKMVFEATAKIVAGTVETAPTEECAEDVVSYFEAVYEKLLAVATSISTADPER